MSEKTRKLALVTGASNGIESELARLASRVDGDLILMAGEADFSEASFLNSFADDLKGGAVTVTRRGPTDTDFIERAYMRDTRLERESQVDPAEVATAGHAAMMAGKAGVVAGLSHKPRVAMAHCMPAGLLVAMQRLQAQPGSAAR